MSMMAQLVDKLEQKLGAEITEIGRRLEGIEEKTDMTSTTLNCKVDFLTNKVEEMMDSVKKTVKTQVEVNETQLVDRMNAHDETFHKQFDDKVDEILKSIDCSVVEMNSVRSKIQEDKEEEEEIQKRKTSVIIHGFGESVDPSPDERQKYDNEEMENLLHRLGADTVSVNKIIRLGKRPETSDAKPRPMKVVFASEEQKDAVLSRAKNVLRKREGALNGIFMHQDLTMKQRKRRQELVAELKHRQSNGETNLIIANWKIVERHGAHREAAYAASTPTPTV